MSMLPVGFGGRRGGYEIKKSLRFRASASASMTRTPPAAATRHMWSFSVWVKRGALGTIQTIYSGYANANNLTTISFNASNQLEISSTTTGVLSARLVTSAVFADPSSHYHILITVDTNNATADDRMKIYVNGEQITSFASRTNPEPNYLFYINSGAPHYFGQKGDGTGYFDGVLSKIDFINGRALVPTDLGRLSPQTNQWVPLPFTGTYGVNGFYLPFSDGSSLTTLGYDESGNGNDWTLNNISLTAGVTYDWLDDTPTNNFATISPIQGSVGAISNANLTLTATASAHQTRAGTIAVHSGKWYWEVTIIVGGNYITVGIDPPNRLYVAGQYPGDAAGGYGYINNGNKYLNTTPTAYGASFTTNDVLGIALDLDTGELEFFKNGVSQGVAFTGISGTFVPSFRVYTNTRAIAINFGQRPFAYSPPTGFKALSTANLPTPAVRKGSGYFDVVLDSGADIKTAGEALFANFFEWIKDRANVNNHQLIDSVRGNTAVLQSNTTGGEDTYTAPSGDSVGWVWRIAAGFLDVVTYTGTGVARTIAHNLGVVPAMMFVKNIDAATNWPVYHKANTTAPETDYLLLNTTAATADLDTVWNDTAPTSSVFSVGTNALVNTLNDTYVAYLFAEVEGFSKFGSYTGNGSANGPFVWCGFKPKFVMIKRSNNTGDWWIYDAERSPANPAIQKLLANTNGAEDVSGEDVDLLANGFKIRSTAAGQNANAATYIFAAFAECPFQHATAR